jgi:hypothetical protein
MALSICIVRPSRRKADAGLPLQICLLREPRGG